VVGWGKKEVASALITPARNVNVIAKAITTKILNTVLVSIKFSYRFCIHLYQDFLPVGTICTLFAICTVLPINFPTWLFTLLVSFAIDPFFRGAIIRFPARVPGPDCEVNILLCLCDRLGAIFLTLFCPPYVQLAEDHPKEKGNDHRDGNPKKKASEYLGKINK
jgi:hypothetical protein